jgi:hypothetical protein
MTIIDIINKVTESLEHNDIDMLVELQEVVSDLLIGDAEYTGLSNLIAAAIEKIEE